MESSAIFSLNGFTSQTNQGTGSERERKQGREVLEEKSLEKRTG